MFTSKKRGLYMILIACFMNTCLSLIAYLLKMPMWLDTAGTIYISIIMGSAYGFCAGLVNNIIFSGFLYGYNSMSYYFVSFLVALVVGTYAKKHKNHSIQYWVVLGMIIFAVSVPTATVFSLLLDAGVPADYHGKILFSNIMNRGYPHVISTVVALATVKAIDVIVSLIITKIAIYFTPEKLLTSKYCVDLYKVRGQI